VFLFVPPYFTDELRPTRLSTATVFHREARSHTPKAPVQKRGTLHDASMPFHSTVQPTVVETARLEI
jgi:hypothetical protein